MKYLERVCDTLWREKVKRRDNWTCRNPSCYGYRMLYSNGDPVGDIAAHHIYRRSNTGSRYLLDNGISLCAWCHKEAHDHPVAFKEKMRLMLGDERFDVITQASRMVCKQTDEMLTAAKRKLEDNLF